MARDEMEVVLEHWARDMANRKGISYEQGLAEVRGSERWRDYERQTYSDRYQALLVLLRSLGGAGLFMGLCTLGVPGIWPVLAMYVLWSHIAASATVGAAFGKNAGWGYFVGLPFAILALLVYSGKVR